MQFGFVIRQYWIHYKTIIHDEVLFQNERTLLAEATIQCEIMAQPFPTSNTYATFLFLSNFFCFVFQLCYIKVFKLFFKDDV